jgi:hypothetical protein
MGGLAAVLRRPIVVVGLLAFAAALSVALWIIRPIHVGAVGYDAAASVLYFQRITGGTRLEAFVGATPKPLLTVVYGTAYALFHDWRIVSCLAIGAYGLGIALTAALAKRVAGPVAGAFAAVGLIGSAGLLVDVDVAYAVPWALCSWALAGLLVTQARPRFALAGVVLGLGALARFETLIVVGCAGAAIALAILVARRSGRDSTPVRAGWPILLGLAALPIQALHDWLLTGDPVYSERVPVLGSLGAPLIGIGGAVRFLIAHYASEPLLVALAAIGLFTLVAQHRWAIALGILALGPGIGAFICFLAARDIYVSTRYVTPADLALTFAAAIAIASIRIHVPGQVTLPRWPPVLVPLAAAATGGLIALMIIRPFGPIDHATRATILQNAAVERDLATVTPTIAASIADDPAAHASPTGGSATAKMGSAARLLVPILTVPQIAVDLKLPLPFVAGSDRAAITDQGGYPRPGQLLFHDVGRDNLGGAYAPFEVAVPTRVGNILVDPLLVEGGRFWLVRIGP